MQLKGALRDGEHVRLGEFLTQLRALQLALASTERIISGEEKPATYYKVVNLTHSSPATVELEATPYKRANDIGEHVIKKFFYGLSRIQETGQISDEYDRIVLESYKGLGQMLHKNLSEVKLSTSGYDIQITSQFEARIDLLLGTDVLRDGSIEGMLEAIYLHNKANKFYIFPTVGPSKVVCHFSDDMMSGAIAAINRYVRVSGQLKFKERGFFPHEVEVEEMKVHPYESDLPTLVSLRGLAPNATGKLDSVDFIRSIRDAQDQT
jgi:hypothetical protein